MTEKDEKTCLNAKTNDFDQRTACGAPVRWSKFHNRYLTMAIIACYFKFARKKRVCIFFMADFISLSGFLGPSPPPPSTTATRTIVYARTISHASVLLHNKRKFS